MKPGVDYIGVGCGALIVNERNETLLVKRGLQSKNEVGLWSKPGGAVELGEKVKDAIIREIKEELGIDIELIDLLGYTDHLMKNDKQHWISFNYSAKIVNGEPKILEPEKIAEIKWFDMNDLPSDTNQNTLESVQAYLSSK